MDRVHIYSPLLDEPIFLNRIGDYGYPSDDAIKRTMNEFFYGSSILDFHRYGSLRRDDLDE